MGYRDQFYPQTVAALIQRFGESAPDASGNRLPITTATQTIAILGTLSPHVVRVLREYNERVTDGDGPFGAMPVGLVDSEGFLRSDPQEFEIGGGGGPFGLSGVKVTTVANQVISWEDYVAGYPDLNTRPSNRAPLGQLGFRTVWMPDVVFESFAETDILAQLRQMMADWQHAVDASADAIRSNVDVSASMGKTQNATFWAAIRRLCTTMDIVDENPPLAMFERVKQAVNSSIDQTAEWTGKAAADLATKVGETAGNLGKGFFAEAGITAIVVAGIAVYMFIK